MVQIYKNVELFSVLVIQNLFFFVFFRNYLIRDQIKKNRFFYKNHEILE